jgi:hypothetical protein
MKLSIKPQQIKMPYSFRHYDQRYRESRTAESAVEPGQQSDTG